MLIGDAPQTVSSKNKTGRWISPTACFAILIAKCALRRSHRPSGLKTFPAKYRAPLRRSEGNCRFLPALRTGGFGFCPWSGAPATPRFRSLCFTRLAALWFVFKALVGEKHLFAACKNELGAALRTLQHLIVEFHCPAPPGPLPGGGPGSSTMGRVGGIDP
jgi:hypothetical protein